MLRSKSNVGRADKEHALKKNQKQSMYQCIAFDLSLCVCHSVACSCFCFCHAVTLKQLTQDNTMSDNDNIRIPDLTSFVIHSITIRRGLAKEIIAKREDHQALYYISYNHGISLQAVGYLSRCRIEEIEEASAIST